MNFDQEIIELISKKDIEFTSLSRESQFYVAGAIESKIKIEFHKGKLMGVSSSRNPAIVKLIQSIFKTSVWKNKKKESKTYRLSLTRDCLTEISTKLSHLQTPYQSAYEDYLKYIEYFVGTTESTIKRNESKKINLVENVLKSFNSSPDKGKESEIFWYKLGSEHAQLTGCTLLPSSLYLPNIEEGQFLYNKEKNTFLTNQMRKRSNKKKAAHRREVEQRKKTRLNQFAIAREKKKEEAKRKLLQYKIDNLSSDHQYRPFATETRLVKELEESIESYLIWDGHFNLCLSCQKYLPFDHFYANNKNKSKKSYYCIQCTNENSIEGRRIYYKKNRERIISKAKAWAKNNPILRKAYSKARDKGIKIKDIKKLSKKESDITGISSTGMTSYLESLFLPGMSWENYGNGSNKWHIDHIIPCAAFDFTIPQHHYWCWNYRNLRPLWEQENTSKSDFIDGVSVRTYQGLNKLDELANVVGNHLQEMGITSKEEYLKSLKEKPIN